MYIHIYTIVGLWLISHLIDDKMPTLDDTNNFIKHLINMELFEGSYLEVAPVGPGGPLSPFGPCLFRSFK